MVNAIGGVIAIYDAIPVTVGGGAARHGTGWRRRRRNRFLIFGTGRKGDRRKPQQGDGLKFHENFPFHTSCLIEAVTLFIPRALFQASGEKHERGKGCPCCDMVAINALFHATTCSNRGVSMTLFRYGRPVENKGQIIRAECQQRPRQPPFLLSAHR